MRMKAKVMNVSKEFNTTKKRDCWIFDIGLVSQTSKLILFFFFTSLAKYEKHIIKRIFETLNLNRLDSFRMKRKGQRKRS